MLSTISYHYMKVIAIDIFYNSQTFANLYNPQTGLYFQSPVYIYDILEKELDI